MKRNPNRVLVGMSGGVDSCVAAALLQEQGYEVIGITIKTYRYEDVGGNVGNDSSCCSLDGINDARRVALQLGFPHYVVDFSETFREHVIDYFVQDYMNGNTPNPCVQCNRHIKWDAMLHKADSLGAQWIATGHYSRLRLDEASGRFIVSRGSDMKKDQSYALWGLSQEALSRTLFPLAGFTKEQSRQEAARFGLAVASKKESYEICFIPDNDYNRFLKDKVPDLQHQVDGGSIVMDGKELGQHSGYPFYTVGQRRGLGLSHPEPLFVLDVLPQSNTLIVGTEDKLLHRSLVGDSLNLMAFGALELPTRVQAKIRYKDEASPALAWQDAEGRLVVVFDEAKRAISPGQSVVLYNNDDVLGGAVIRESFAEALEFA